MAPNECSLRSISHMSIPRSKEQPWVDLGCGTGGAGAWLKDYARSLTGVDLSENMIALARKKLLYQDLHVQSLNEYLQTSVKTFDLVVASDVLSYVGALESTFQQVIN